MPNPEMQAPLITTMETSAAAHSLMKSPAVCLRSAVCCLLGLGLSPILVSAARAAEGGEVTAVSAKVSDDYIRRKLPSGSFQPETYAFGAGGQWGGAMHDDTIDKLTFLDVARTIAIPLAAQNYLPTKIPKETKLLIMVYWGTTAGTQNPGSSFAYQSLSSANQALAAANQRLSIASAQMKANQNSGASSSSEKFMALIERDEAMSQFESSLLLQGMEDRLRDKADVANARMLGYDSTGLIGTDSGRLMEFTALRYRQRDLIDDIEDNRYFVVLMAYDFQLLLQQKKHKLLWETRFSIRERGNDFSRQLAGMAQNASRYFGQDSHGLLRKPLPEGHVKLGDLKVLEVVPEK